VTGTAATLPMGGASSNRDAVRAGMLGSSKSGQERLDGLLLDATSSSLPCAPELAGLARVGQFASEKYRFAHLHRTVWLQIRPQIRRNALAEDLCEGVSPGSGARI